MKKYYILCSLLLLALLCPTALKAGNYVIINQVMYDAPGNETPSLPHASEGEFVELYNAGTAPVSLDGWSIQSGDDQNERYVFPSNVTIPVKGYLLLARRKIDYTDNDFSLGAFYESLNGNSRILYQSNFYLANQSDTLILLNNNKDTIDWICFGGQTKLVATNKTGIPGNECKSLHRTWVEFDENGKAIISVNDWATDLVSFGVNNLPHDSYYETYLTGGEELPTGDNYVLAITPLDPTTSIKLEDGNPHFSSAVRTHAAIRYMDGLGRTEETIALGVTPSKKDLVCVTDYYGKRNVSKQWLPVVAETEGQRMDVSEIQERAQDAYESSSPYTQTTYENSASHRPLEKTRPGYSGHAKKQTYALNAANEVRMFIVKNDGSLRFDGYYSAATLYKTTETDEDGKSVVTYTDKQGRKIMDMHGTSEVYYVYDNIGRLRYMLPNISNKIVSGKDYKWDNEILKSASYCYQYDNRGNMICKRLPGCEPQYMVYDQMGQLVLKQDGNQRVEGKWTFCVYDSIGRNIIISEIKFKRKKDTHENLVKDFADKWSAEPWAKGTVSNDTKYGYALSLLKPYGTNNELGLKLLLINYYDNYDFLDKDKHKELSVNFDQKSAYGPKTNSTIGLLTGTCVFDLSEEGYTTTANYYDDKGCVVQTHSRRSRDGYETLTNSKYNFDGSVAETKTVQKIGTDIVTEHYAYTYDHTGRALETKYQLNDDPEITLSKLSYDEQGRLVRNLLHDSKDKIEYSYDMRNMLTETKSKHFTEKLLYANPPRSMIAKPCYNGNISAVEMSFDDKDAEPYRFDFIYDDQNRLIVMDERVYDDKTGMVTVAPIESFAYDDMGNITSIKRWYYNNRRNISRFLCIADLQYHYGNEGNQLLSVINNEKPIDNNNFLDYYDRSKEEIEMSYDANGNLKSDADRKITEIRYNILNLPEYIEFSTGHRVVNMYDAAGKKYKSIYFTNPLAGSSVSEIANHEYEFSPEEEGCRITEYFGTITKEQEMRTFSWETTQTIHNAIGYYKSGVHYHYLKDHLGNVCAVVSSEADQVVQKTAYYASGVPMTYSRNRGVQPYLYNGKEFVEDPGCDVYDYGFRGYYTTIGRFTSMDPLCEQTPWQSPYAYAANNFVSNIDWMGLMSVCQCVVTNIRGEVINVVNDNDNNIYICLDDTWEESDGKGGLIWAAEMEHSYYWYWSRYIISELGGGGGGHFYALSGTQVATAIGRSLLKDVSLGVADGFLRDEYGKKMGRIGNMTTKIIASGKTIDNLYHVFDHYMSQGYSPRVAYDAAKEILTLGAKFALDGSVEKLVAMAAEAGLAAEAAGLTAEVVAAAEVVGPIVVGAAMVALTSYCYYKAGEYFMNMTWNLECTLSSKAFWGYWYGFGSDGSDWK